MSLKTESIIKIILFIATFIYIVILYLSFENKTILLLSGVGLSLLLIVVYMYYRDAKKNFIINSLYDTQTKLYNRQYFLAELSTTHERALRYKSPLSIIMITIKDFMNFSAKEQSNILKEMGKTMLNHTRQSDIVSRFDDDKVMMLLPMTDYLHASIAKDRFKNILASIDFENGVNVEFIFTIVENDLSESSDEFLIRCLESNISSQ